MIMIMSVIAMFVSRLQRNKGNYNLLYHNQIWGNGSACLVGGTKCIIVACSFVSISAR